MRKCFLILLFFLAWSLGGLSQKQIDSLKNSLLTARDTERINTLNLLSRQILFGAQVKNYLDTAEYFAHEANALSKKFHFSKGTGNALLNKAIISTRKRDNFHSTLFSLQLALSILKDAGDWFSVADCFSATAECYHYLGDNKKAIIFFDSCVHLFQQLGDTTGSAWNIISKGHSYYDLGNYAEAYKTFQSALDLASKNDTFLQGFAYCNMARLFVGADLPEIAIEYMNKVRAFYPVLTAEQQHNLPWPLRMALETGGEAFLQLNQTDSAFKIASLLNIPLQDQAEWDNLFYGHLYTALGLHEKALIYFIQGYKQSQHASHEISLARHANALAVTYLALKNYGQAIYYAKEAIEISERIHALLEQKNAVGTLSNVYAATKDYSRAYRYNELYKSLNAALLPEEYKRKLALLQVKDQLVIQKKEAELAFSQNLISRQQIKIQESSLKRKSLLLYIFIAAFFVMILLVILVNRNITLRRRKTELHQLMEQVNAHQKLTELEKEKANLEMQALRAQMNPHFIFNCLSSINRFILINKIDEASDYLTKFSRLIRMALQNSEKTSISLESELDALRLYLDLERLRFKNGFNYSITFINEIDVNAVYIPPMLIQPFAENAIWHGLMHKKGVGLMEIQLCAENKKLTCVIKDNGIGRNMAASLNMRSAEKNKSMGVDITAGRLALLNHSKNDEIFLKIEDILDDEGTGCGTKVILTIPYKDLTEIIA